MTLFVNVAAAMIASRRLESSGWSETLAWIAGYLNDACRYGGPQRSSARPAARSARPRSLATLPPIVSVGWLCAHVKTEALWIDAGGSAARRR